MASLLTLSVGGVPEHFNLPWHLAAEAGAFAEAGLHIDWRDYSGGTGAMAKDLREGTLDVAVLLTEGIVADIAQGNPSRIIAPYVVSPLVWGIHVPAASAFTSVEALEGKRFAISRYGSGSHLMASVHAQLRGWDPQALSLVLVGDLNGARQAFECREADGFMWEKAMTQPLVDSGEFRRVGECPTPWPCFVIAARQPVIHAHADGLRRMLAVIQQASQQFKQSLETIPLVVKQFGILPADASAWLARTQWANGAPLAAEVLERVSQTLLELRLIPQPVAPADLYEGL